MYNYGDFPFDDFLLLQGTLPIIVKKTGVRIYDFNFRDYLECKSVLNEYKAAWSSGFFFGKTKWLV